MMGWNERGVDAVWCDEVLCGEANCGGWLGMERGGVACGGLGDVRWGTVVKYGVSLGVSLGEALLGGV